MQPDPSLQSDIKTALAQSRNVRLDGDNVLALYTALPSQIGDSHFRNMIKNPSWYAGLLSYKGAGTHLVPP